MKKDPSREYIHMICCLYGDRYDDREEDSRPGGESWIPGQKARHKSLAAFQRELKEIHGIKLSAPKILKILITGGLWTTERTREVGELFEKNIMSSEYGGGGKNKAMAVQAVAEELEISKAMVCMSLPYDRVVYDVPGKSGNAVRCERSRRKKKGRAPGRPSGYNEFFSKDREEEWVMDRVQRVREMEARLNRIGAWLESSGPSVEEDVRILGEYYQSPLWRSDFEADEAGEMPADLLRGVLSEDAVYNVLTEYEERKNSQSGE